MKVSTVIKQPIFSEKAYKQMESGIYHFLVDQRAGKSEIATVVAKQFSVKVKKVNIISLPTITKRITGTRLSAQINQGKKAIVYLEKGQSIAVLAPSKESKSKNDKKVTKVARESEGSVVKKGLLSKIRKSKTEQEGSK